MKNVDLNLLSVFLTICETGSLSKSSDHLGLTQPGVSLALKRLRDHFQDPLFVRTSKGMEPTNFALAIFPTVKSAADILRDFLRFQLNFEPQQSERIFRLAISDFGQLLILPRLLTFLSTAAPKVRLEVTGITSRIEDDLAAGIVDLALGISHPTKEYFYQQLLIHSNYTGLVSIDHPEIGDAVTHLQYEQVMHLSVKSQTSGFYLVNKKLEQIGINRKLAINLCNHTGITNILTKTNYFLTVPECVADAVVKHGRLKKVALPFELPTWSLMQHWHIRQDVDPGNRWLRDLISTLKAD